MSGAVKKIKMILADKGMTITELAQEYGISRQGLYNMIQRDNPNYETAEKLADCLGCDIVFKDRQTGKEYS